MRRPEKEVLERLGPEGLTRALGDLLDQDRLVRLANSCGLKYPGMRTRSQSRERILADLVERSTHEASARRAILRALQKETRATHREWAGLSAEDRQKRLADDAFLLSNGQLARHLLLLAASDVDADHTELAQLLERQKLLHAAPASAKAATKKPSREATRLNRRVTELQKKVKHLESQLAKSREAEKTFKRDLIRRKGELAESRMLGGRLQKELDKLRQQVERVSARQKSTAPAQLGIEPLGKAVRQLATQQKKLAHQIEKAGAAPAPPTSVSQESLQPLMKELAKLRSDLASARREAKKNDARQSKRLEELRAGMDDGAKAAATPRAAAQPGPERVGVFIDVQNMYYGARQLKGKLDFDALMKAAVRDRRLIQATAYVVESKEIDQSGFIAILRKLAIGVRRKTLQVRADGSMKGDWDMELALDVLDAAAGLDVVVLVSGDGDFTSLVERVKRMGPRVELFGFPRNTAKSLLEAADDYQPLNRKFMIYAARTKPARPKSKAKKASASKNAPSS